MAKAKTVIRWKPVAMADPSDRTKTIVTPSIVDRQDSIDLGQLVEQAIDTGRIAGVKPEFSQAIGEALAAQIGATLKSGRGVKFGQYFYVRLYLNGTLESMKSALGAENKLNAVLVPGNELRLAKDDFTFRNVLDTGDNPTIDNVFNADVSGENDVIGDWSRAIAITGSYLKGATITATWKEGGVTKKSAVQTPLQMDSNPLLQFLMDPSAVDPDAGITGGVPADNTMVTFEVAVARTVEGQTTVVKDT